MPSSLPPSLPPSQSSAITSSSPLTIDPFFLPTITTAPTATTTATAAATAAQPNLDTPLLNPFLMPFSSDPAAFAGFPWLSTSASTPAAAPAAAPVDTLPSPAARPTVATNSTDPAIAQIERVMEDIAGVSGFGSNFSSNFFSDMLLRPARTSTPYASVSPRPSPATTTTTTTTLPSRPSPRISAATATSLDMGGGPSSFSSSFPSSFASPFPSSFPSSFESPAALPSHRARKKNRPVVSAMMQYVNKLSPHQKRLILKALLEDGEAVGTSPVVDDRTVVDETDANADNVDAFDDDFFEEIDDIDDIDATDAGGVGYGKGDRSTLVPWHGTAPHSTTTAWRGSEATPATQAGGLGGDLGTNVFSAFMERATASVAGAGAAASTSAAFGNLLSTSNAMPPLIMSLQCRRTTFQFAVIENCLACGLPDPGILFDESASCDEGTCGSCEYVQSPFALDAEEARAVVSGGPARISSALAAMRLRIARRTGGPPPRDLLPVDEQILVAHHPYVDIIPFRGFRARALALLAEMEAAEEVAAAVGSELQQVLLDPDHGSVGRTPREVACLLDEDELCYDMNVADGLVCWGSQVGDNGGGESARARRDWTTGGRDMRACVPWDMRSWEPQVWFLKKYWFLVGGWDDDMWRNCRWWHSMRGEDLEYSVYATPGY